MSETALARSLEWHLIMISRMETGFRPSTTVDVVQYLVACGMKYRDMKPFVEFTRHAELKQGYHLSDHKLGGSLQSLIFHESSAGLSFQYEPQVINGLLQTPDYARAIITRHVTNADDRVAGAVSTRMERQRVLSRSNPGRFTFYLHEHALRLRIGNDKIMHEQLLQLVLISALDNITVRIVPSAAGERSVFGGSFKLMEFNEHRPIVYLDFLRSGLILEEPDHVKSYHDIQPRLADVAMDRERSRKFLTKLADAYDQRIQRSVASVPTREWLERPSGSDVVVSRTPIYEA